MSSSGIASGTSLYCITYTEVNREAHSEEEFEAILREILSSAEMKRILEVLLAQSESVKPTPQPTGTQHVIMPPR